MAQAGGGPPVIESIRVPKPRVVPGDTVKPDVSYDIVWIILGVFVAGGLLGLGYYYFFSGGSSALPPSKTPPKATSTSGTLPSGGITHHSFFVNAADATVSFTQGAPAANANELQSYGQRIQSLLSSSSASGYFFEVTMQQSGGQAMTLSQLLSFLNAPILDAKFLTAHFSEDFTYFVYRGENGYWPGYILKLKSGDDARLLHDAVAALENSPYVGNLFLFTPGNPAGGFSNSLISNEPVRREQFSSDAAFIYGWFEDKYLILSTSVSGFSEAVSRLAN